MFPARLAWFDPAEAELEQELFDANDRAVIGGNAPPVEAPAKRKRVFKRRCPETGVTFETTGKDRQFATDQAKADFHNRSSKIGRKLVPLAMAWRMGRNAKGNTPQARALRASAAWAFGEMCHVLDQNVTDDRLNARMGKLDYVRQRAAMQGNLGEGERVSYQTKLIEAEAAVRQRLGEKAMDMTLRQITDLAAKDIRRQAREEKEGLLARMKAGVR